MEENQESISQTETEKQAPKFNPLMIGGIIVVVLLLIGGYLLTKRKSTESVSSEVMGETQEDATPTPKATSSAVDETGAQVITVEAGSYYYKPNVIKVKVGQKIKLVMNSVDMAHNFNIDELNVHLPITREGNSNSVVFTADQAGTFEYYCSVANHRQLGQVGKLIVE